MNKKIMCIVMLVSMCAVFSDDTALHTSTVTVTVVDAKNDKGIISVSLCNSRESYEKPNTSFMVCSQSIRNGQSILIFEHVPDGVYAIKLFHDKNSNGELDTGIFGIPKEDYAFSNNVPGPFGPPDFEKVKFRVDGDTAIEIRLN